MATLPWFPRSGRARGTAPPRAGCPAVTLRHGIGNPPTPHVRCVLQLSRHPIRAFGCPKNGSNTFLIAGRSHDIGTPDPRTWAASSIFAGRIRGGSATNTQSAVKGTAELAGSIRQGRGEETFRPRHRQRQNRPPAGQPAGRFCGVGLSRPGRPGRRRPGRSTVPGFPPGFEPSRPGQRSPRVRGRGRCRHCLLPRCRLRGCRPGRR